MYLPRRKSLMRSVLALVFLLFAVLAWWAWSGPVRQEVSAAVGLKSQGASPEVDVDLAPEHLTRTLVAVGQLTLSVKDVLGQPISNALASVSSDAAGHSWPASLDGVISVSPRPAEQERITVGAAGFVAKVIPVRGLGVVEDVQLARIGDVPVSRRIVDETGEPIAGVRVRLTLEGSVSGRVLTYDAQTEEDGWARFEGVTTGKYLFGVHLGPVDLSQLVQTDQRSILAPSADADLVLRMPRIAWAQPADGRIVTGYFRCRLGDADFGRLRPLLRVTKDYLEGVSPGSLASVFMESQGDVTFAGLLDPGGWTTAVVPVGRVGGQSHPVVIDNAGAAPVEFGSLVVHAQSIDGSVMKEAPFALQLSSKAKLGSFTFDVDYNQKNKLPIGRYVFVALQVGASKLFDGPRHAIEIAAGADAAVRLRAKYHLRKVALAIEQVPLRVSGQVEIGLVRIRSESEFVTELRPATSTSVWLPSGRALTAVARCRRGLVHVDLKGEFHVPERGASDVRVIMREVE